MLLPPGGGALFLDWDRAGFTGSDVELMPRYRARLERSLKKLGAPAEAFAVMAPEPRP